MCDCFVFEIYVVALFLVLSYLFYSSVLRVLVVLVSSVCFPESSVCVSLFAPRSPSRWVVSLVSVLFPCLVSQIMSNRAPQVSPLCLIPSCVYIVSVSLLSPCVAHVLWFPCVSCLGFLFSSLFQFNFILYYAWSARIKSLLSVQTSLSSSHSRHNKLALQA